MDSHTHPLVGGPQKRQLVRPRVVQLQRSSEAWTNYLGEGQVVSGARCLWIIKSVEPCGWRSPLSWGDWLLGRMSDKAWDLLGFPWALPSEILLQSRNLSCKSWTPWRDCWLRESRSETAFYSGGPFPSGSLDTRGFSTTGPDDTWSGKKTQWKKRVGRGGWIWRRMKYNWQKPHTRRGGAAFVSTEPHVTLPGLRASRVAKARDQPGHSSASTLFVLLVKRF